MSQNPRNKRGRPSKPLLSRSKILTAGLELVDTEGLSSFSVQTVAERLGVTGPSVYYYFADRDDLLRGLGLVVLREMRDLHDATADSDAPRSWQAWIRDYADALYTAASRHPNAVPILLARQTHGDSADLFEIALSDLVKGGLDPHLGLTALDAMEGVVLAWISFDQAREPNWGYGDLDPQRFPMMAQVFSELDAPEERLKVSIEALIAGFEVLSAKASAARRRLLLSHTTGPTDSGDTRS